MTVRAQLDVTLDRRLEGMLGALDADVHLAAWVDAPGQPVPKARARVTARGTFTPKTSVDAEKRLACQMLKLGRWHGNVALACIFYRADRRQCDGDNLLKLVKDAGNRARIWRDDCQVTASAVVIELDRMSPRTLIALAPHKSTLRRDLTLVRV